MTKSPFYQVSQDYRTSTVKEHCSILPKNKVENHLTTSAESSNMAEIARQTALDGNAHRCSNRTLVLERDGMPVDKHSDEYRAYQRELMRRRRAEAKSGGTECKTTESAPTPASSKTTSPSKALTGVANTSTTSTIPKPPSPRVSSNTAKTVNSPSSSEPYPFMKVREVPARQHTDESYLYIKSGNGYLRTIEGLSRAVLVLCRRQNSPWARLYWHRPGHEADYEIIIARNDEAQYHPTYPPGALSGDIPGFVMTDDYTESDVATLLKAILYEGE